jgi:hypothetical protein
MDTDAPLDPVLEEVPLGDRWPTVDPFLFCVHHVDHYPAGDGAFGPAASLAGRDLGMDFAGIDGWRMYHGHTVPGFPQHPHRGFETVTYVRRGLIDHADSLGAAARFGRGDVQWMTAGKGVVHAEMFPLLDVAAPNDAELFQIWLNLPAASKFADPCYSIFWDDEIPRVVEVHDGATTEVTVIAGRLGTADPPSPPPASYAGDAGHDVAIWHVRCEAGARWTLPAASAADTVRIAYVFDGDGVAFGSRPIGRDTAVRLVADVPVPVTSPGGGEFLVLQGRPIGEPVAQYGPFVMNHRHEIVEAVEDYQATGFGGWPWPDDGPVHGADPSRFARHADGRTERRADGDARSDPVPTPTPRSSDG